MDSDSWMRLGWTVVLGVVLGAVGVWLNLGIDPLRRFVWLVAVGCSASLMVPPLALASRQLAVWAGRFGASRMLAPRGD